MFKDKIKLLKTKFIKESEGNNKRKIENLLVFLVLLIITVIAINTIWGTDKQENEKGENTSLYKQLALDNTNNSNKEEHVEYNLEESLEDILSKMSGVGKVDVLITYSQSSEVVAMYNESHTSSSTEETDTNGGTRIIEETDTNKEIIFEDVDGEKTPITQKIVMPKIEGAIVTAEGAREYKYQNKYNSGYKRGDWTCYIQDTSFRNVIIINNVGVGFHPDPYNQKNY